MANVLKHCQFIANNNHILTLAINEKLSEILTNTIKIQIDKQLQEYVASIVINVVQNTGETLAKKEQNKEYQKLKQAQNIFLNNPSVKKIQEVFEITFDPNSIKI